MQLWHVALSSTNRLPLFSTESLRREAIYALVSIAGLEMVLFSIVDDHLHLVSIGDRERTRRIRQAIRRRLTGIAEAPVAPSWAGPVKDRKHLLTLVRYHLFQVIKHSVQDVHPALWSGSCFQDLIGARCIEGLQLQLGLVVPRQQIAVLACKEVGLQGWDIQMIDAIGLRQVGISRIKAAAAAAANAAPTLEGSFQVEALARRATAHLGVAAKISKEEVCWVLGLTRQGLFMVLRKEAPQALMSATKIRLALEIEVERRSTLIRCG